MIKTIRSGHRSAYSRNRLQMSPVDTCWRQIIMLQENNFKKCWGYIADS